jgi:hypothetical protein
MINVFTFSPHEHVVLLALTALMWLRCIYKISKEEAVDLFKNDSHETS